MQGTHDITLSGHHKPVLLALEYIGCGEFAIRYSCRDSEIFNFVYEIKDTIMSFDRSERRWDPDQMCGGKYGCWLVSEYVLDELTRYFPNIDAWLKKSAQPAAASRNIEECPF
jgi:hypothetical protein